MMLQTLQLDATAKRDAASSLTSQVTSPSQRPTEIVSPQAITNFVKKLDLLAVVSVTGHCRQSSTESLSPSPQIDVLYAHSSFDVSMGKQQAVSFCLREGQGTSSSLRPFEVTDCRHWKHQHSEHSRKQRLVASGVSCPLGRVSLGYQSQVRESQPYVPSANSDDNSPFYVVSDCGISAGEQTQPSKLPLSLLLWSRQALSTSQKYCIEQQVRLMQLTERLQQERTCSTQKISLLEQALQQIEHQLRTPLSLVELYTDLLSSSAESVTKPVQAIRQIVSDMSISLKRLASCGLMNRKQVSTCDLRSIIQESVSAMRSQSEQKQLSVLCDSHSLPLTVDAWQMQQVFHNLLNNAIAFSPSGGIVDCRWTVYQQEVLIEIRDQGPGFSAQDLKSLFRPYYSRREGGTGLGLAIAQKVVLDHQGTITAANLPEGGAQLSIMLPRL